MKAKLSHIQSGISKWYLKDIAPMGWKAMLAAPLVNLSVTNALRKQEGVISLLTDENGDIDIESLYRDYAEIINKAGVVELFGMKFNTQDLESLFESIKSEIPVK